jgi:hypothetical protein
MQAVYDSVVEVFVSTDGQEVELRGILDSISNRFYRGGWGFGTLYTDRGIVKITGTLEGHVTGTSLVVRGAYKDTTYGRQLDCSSIIVDQVSGEMNVIRSWARRHAKEFESDVVRVTKSLEPEERWKFLADAEQLVRAGFDDDVAHELAGRAKSYLLLIETKKGLMEQGFSDQEAEKLCAHYKEGVLRILDEDPYGIVIDRVLAFTRIDTVVDGKVARNDVRRLHAAVVQSLVGAMRNGHTAVDPKGAQREAADIAGVYIDAVQNAGLPKVVVLFNDKLQLRTTAWNEQDIAAWLIEAMKIEEHDVA